MAFTWIPEAYKKPCAVEKSAGRVNIKHTLSEIPNMIEKPESIGLMESRISSTPGLLALQVKIISSAVMRRVQMDASRACGRVRRGYRWIRGELIIGGKTKTHLSDIVGEKNHTLCSNIPPCSEREHTEEI
jgi:hypothetical protein